MVRARFFSGFLFLFVFCLNYPVFCQAIFPLNEVKRGMKGYGLSDFGNGVEKFDFMVVGKIRIPNGFELIEVKLSGGPKNEEGEYILKKSRVIGGMSGSPLYALDGRILGAIRSTYPLNLEARGQAVPFEYMVNWRPLSFNIENFKKNTSRHKSLGEILTPKSKIIPPGSAFGTALIWGEDVFLSGVGTITYVKGDTFLSLGHTFLDLESAGLPVFSAKILDINQNYFLSGKIANVDFNRVPIGIAFYDGKFGMTGVFGERPRSIAVRTVIKGLFPEALETNSNMAILPSKVYPKLLDAFLFDKLKNLFGGSLELWVKTSIQIKGIPEIKISEKYSQNLAGLRVLGILGEMRKDFLDETVKISFEIEKKLTKNVFLTKEGNLNSGDTDGDSESESDIFVEKGSKTSNFQVWLNTNGDGTRWVNKISMPFKDSLFGEKVYAANGVSALNKFIKTLPFDEHSFLDAVSKIGETNRIYFFRVTPLNYSSGVKKENSKNKWIASKPLSELKVLAVIELPEGDYFLANNELEFVFKEQKNKDADKKNSKKSADLSWLEYFVSFFETVFNN